MNAVIENLLTRRSVRSFRDQAISEEDLQLILKTAAYAPSGMGKPVFRRSTRKVPAFLFFHSVHPFL